MSDFKSQARCFQLNDVLCSHFKVVDDSSVVPIFPPSLTNTRIYLMKLVFLLLTDSKLPHEPGAQAKREQQPALSVLRPAHQEPSEEDPHGQPGEAHKKQLRRELFTEAFRNCSSKWLTLEAVGYTSHRRPQMNPFAYLAAVPHREDPGG